MLRRLSTFSVVGLAFAITLSLMYNDMSTLEQAMNQMMGQPPPLLHLPEPPMTDETNATTDSLPANETNATAADWLTYWLPAHTKPTGHSTISFNHSFPSYRRVTKRMRKRGINRITIHQLIHETTATKSSFLSHLHQDNNFTRGYVHDAKYVRQHADQFPFTIHPAEYGSICAPPGLGPEGNTAYHVLTSRLRIANMTGNKTPPKVFCAIYSYEGAKDRVQAVLETWGKRCDGFMVASSFSNQSVGTIDLLHLGKPGSYDSMWQKVRSMLAYMYEHYLDDYDFFHVSGDDVFLIVENLKAYLSSMNPEEVLYAGEWIRGGKTLPDDFVYAGGGPGYTLSRGALKRFVEKAMLTCFASTQVSFEDLLMGVCMRFFLGVPRPADTVDEAINQRYHGADPQLAAEYHLVRHGRLGARPEDVLISQFFKVQYQWQNKFLKRAQVLGLESISPLSVSFHIVKSPAKMRRFEKLLYRKDVADCTCDGKDEPGRAIATELEGHNGCRWNYRYGSFWDIENCTSWQEQMKRRPPAC